MQSRRRGIVDSAVLRGTRITMTAQVEVALRVLRTVAERPDPTSPLGSGDVARVLGESPSRISRVCAELERTGLIAGGGRYGSHGLGREAVRLSGRAAAPVARSVRYALTLAAQYTGETACVAARAGDSVHISASVGSEWTLHASADVGERIANGTAIADAATERTDLGDGAPRVFESRSASVVEVATPIIGPDGECVAVVAVRLPTHRATGGVPRARRAVVAARRRIESMIGRARRAPDDRGPVDVPSRDRSRSEPALDATVRILGRLAEGADTPAGIARSTGLRLDRVQRLLDAGIRAGVVETRSDAGIVELGWGIHGWHRSATVPVLTSTGAELVAEAAADAGVFGFITILKGIRSFTVVEELGSPDGGIVMMPWLGRPHPVIGSDGGPTLVMEFQPDDLAGLLQKRHPAHEFELLVERIREVTRAGVITIDSDHDAGLISVSAPIRDASGAVAGAACLTGGTDSVRHRRSEIEDATRALAGRLSDLLR
ncbi:helix-turn-helix domain-containing protein [Labedella endophytica]|uniref:helix-turn-helix domain-containing protein n=1 Tax=Labedella endophytica TaxID=1523160 RepID=UPI00140AFB07|nr:helix-turn-helix domain-containing protein [Labedella endophytica]